MLVRFFWKCFLLLFMVFGLRPLLAQEAGRVSGRVIDNASGEPLIGVTVIIRPAGSIEPVFGVTDVEGRYVLINVAVGSQSITFQMMGYENNVQKVNVETGKTIDVSVALSYKTATEIVVKGRLVSKTSAAMLSRRKKAAAAQDAISSEQIKKSPDSNAADAAKRVTGVTIVGGKFIYVRGLGERYSNVMFNGSTLPSPEPEKRVVPLDIFPAALLDNIIITKTYLAENPGDFSGGLVQINTLDYPEQKELNISLGSGYHTLTTGKKFRSYSGGQLDWAGFDDGARKLPGSYPGYPNYNTLSSTEKAKIAQDFQNVWDTKDTKGMLPFSFNFSYGNTYQLGLDSKFGVMVTGLFKESSENVTMKYAQYSKQGSTLYDYDQQFSTYTATSSALVSLAYSSSFRHRLRFTSMYTHTGIQETAYTTGYNVDKDQFVKYNTLGFTENTLFFNQLTGDHVLEFLGNSKFSYNIAASFAGRDFPDFRRATYGLDSGASAATPYGSYFNGSTGNRTFNDHLDTVYEILPKIEIPFKQWSDLSAKLSVGGGFSFRERDSRTYKFIYEGPNVVSETSLQGILTDSALENGSYKMSDLTTPPDKMKGTSTIGAGFIQIDIPLIRSLRLIGGVRYEYYFMQVHTADLLSNQPRISQIEKNDILPALNIVQALSQDMNLRFAVSRTVTRPDFREISSSYIEKILGSYERGNPDLEPTSITNADIRWEIFPTSAEIIAVSGFYKFLDKPIENVLLMNADKPISYVNAENAKNMGIEIELRENLGFIARAMSNFSLAINGSYIYSRVSLGEPKLLGSGYTNKVRPLQGQSPYIINSIISYDNKDLGTSFSLLYYHFGKRIIVIGSNGIDDMYEQANGKLDLTLKQNIVNDASFKFSVSNILDPQIKTTQQTDLGEKIARSYKKGISMDLSFNYTF